MCSELAAISNEKIKILEIETLKINPNDTIIVTADTDIWDIDEISNIIKIFEKTFPKNTIIAKLKGFDIKVEKSEE